MTLRLSMTTSILIACLGAAATACSGGGDKEGAANNQAEAAPAVPAQNRWVRVGVGGCEGNDTGRSDGGEPTAAMCDRAWATAVCWDGETHRNGAQAWCTYKTTPASQCTDGETRGVIYTCEPGAPPTT
ncbi:MAG TPA: hypothetical protein VGC46_08805 [Allosphingosinicella sp.]